MGGAIGSAIGTLYGTSQPPLGLEYTMSIVCIFMGFLWCYRAYSKPFDVRPFHIRDLFGTVWTPPKIGGPTKTQLWIEGISLLALGIGGLLFFRYLNLHAVRY